MWDEFGNWTSDSSYNAPAVPAVAQTDVLQGTQSAPVGNDNWTGFWQDTVKGVLGYGMAKDVAQTRSQAVTQQSQAAYRAAQYQQQQGGNGLLMLMLIGGAVFMLAKD